MNFYGHSMAYMLNIVLQSSNTSEGKYMFRWLFILFFLTGCTIHKTPINQTRLSKSTDKPPATSNTFKTIGVISIIGDALQCEHTGFTVFNNEEQRYQLPTSLNEQLVQYAVTKFATDGVVLKPLNREALSFINDEIGVSQFTNIKLKKHTEIELLLVLSGTFEYRSKDGYYAEDNALNTNARGVLYQLSSGEIISEAEHYQYDLKKQFSCTLDAFPDNDELYELIKKAGTESQEVVVKTLIKSLSPKQSPN